MATPLLTQPIAGPFTLTWAPLGASPTTLGVVGARGIREVREYQSEEVGADLLGGAAIDDVHLCSRLRLEFELEEPNLLAVQKISHPFAVTAQDTLANCLLGEGELGIPGVMHTAKYGEIVATPAFGVNNPAGAQSTPVRTYGICTLYPGFTFNQLLAARRKIVPLQIRCYPYISSGKYVFYTKSALS